MDMECVKELAWNKIVGMKKGGWVKPVLGLYSDIVYIGVYYTYPIPTL